VVVSGLGEHRTLGSGAGTIGGSDTGDGGVARILVVRKGAWPRKMVSCCAGWVGEF
jgi:hypothetical protein